MSSLLLVLLLVVAVLPDIVNEGDAADVDTMKCNDKSFAE